MSRLVKCNTCKGFGTTAEYDEDIGYWDLKTFIIKIKKIKNKIKRRKLIRKYRKLQKQIRVLCPKCRGKGFIYIKERKDELKDG